MADDQIVKNIKALLHMHATGLLGGEIMPEDALLGVVAKDDLPNVLTLGMALNYQRNSYALWRSVAEAYVDDHSRWIFHPQTVATCDREELREALLRHRVGLQPNRHPEIWQRVASGIVQSSTSGDVDGLIKSADCDVAVLKAIMQGTRKTEFPYLSGPKIFNYWLYVLENYTETSWKSRELITIAPDTHILQASVQLGICTAEVLGGTAEHRQAVAEAWEAALQGSGLAPIDVHTPLWLWSRSGFPPLVHLPTTPATL
ncbi:hypothetical protein CIG75_04870 [Tumebacillus algifaecis]|uniref:Uncharacterized protein n=1 Tax=Tumebacillus algifaecis TaxID=1214604 RepID=A0A223CYH4_9BACL|nr:hypothetical protein [Tumebacillus algifaecis]ASS74381.1 hypothetical protein CIG75_04870 [Tumebacillus algifaecis]